MDDELDFEELEEGESFVNSLLGYEEHRESDDDRDRPEDREDMPDSEAQTHTQLNGDSDDSGDSSDSFHSAHSSDSRDSVHKDDSSESGDSADSADSEFLNIKQELLKITSANEVKNDIRQTSENVSVINNESVEEKNEKQKQTFLNREKSAKEVKKAIPQTSQNISEIIKQSVEEKSAKQKQTFLNRETSAKEVKKAIPQTSEYISKIINQSVEEKNAKQKQTFSNIFTSAKEVKKAIPQTSESISEIIKQSVEEKSSKQKQTLLNIPTSSKEVKKTLTTTITVSDQTEFSNNWTNNYSEALRNNFRKTPEADKRYYNSIRNYLLNKVIPHDALKAQGSTKEDFKRETKSFKIKNGKLYYKNLEVIEDDDKIMELTRECHLDKFKKHLTVTQTVRSISRKYFWGGIKFSAEDIFNACLVCNPFQAHSISFQLWKLIEVGIISDVIIIRDLNKKSSKIDCTTLETISAISLVKHIISFFPKFGIPDAIRLVNSSIIDVTFAHNFINCLKNEVLNFIDNMKVVVNHRTLDKHFTSTLPLVNIRSEVENNKCPTTEAELDYFAFDTTDNGRPLYVFYSNHWAMDKDILANLTLYINNVKSKMNNWVEMLPLLSMDLEINQINIKANECNKEIKLESSQSKSSKLSKEVEQLKKEGEDFKNRHLRKKNRIPNQTLESDLHLSSDDDSSYNGSKSSSIISVVTSNFTEDNSRSNSQSLQNMPIIQTSILKEPEINIKYDENIKLKNCVVSLEFYSIEFIKRAIEGEEPFEEKVIEEPLNKSEILTDFNSQSQTKSVSIAETKTSSNKTRSLTEIPMFEDIVITNSTAKQKVSAKKFDLTTKKVNESKERDVEWKPKKTSSLQSNTKRKASSNSDLMSSKKRNIDSSRKRKILSSSEDSSDESVVQSSKKKKASMKAVNTRSTPQSSNVKSTHSSTSKVDNQVLNTNILNLSESESESDSDYEIEVKDSSEISSHQMNKIKILKCPSCAYETNEEKLLMSHKAVHKTHLCDICFAKFTSIDELENHKSSTHPIDKIDSILYGCDCQQFQCYGVNSIEDHLKSHVKLIDRLNEKCQCLICNIPIVMSYEDLLKHMNSMHCKFKCHICLYRSSKVSDLERHVTNSHKQYRKEFFCHFCDCEYGCFASLADHQRAEHFIEWTDNGQKCCICPILIVSENPYDILEHLVSHIENYYLYQCKHDNAKSNSRSEMENHCTNKHKSLNVAEFIEAIDHTYIFQELAKQSKLRNTNNNRKLPNHKETENAIAALIEDHNNFESDGNIDDMPFIPDSQDTLEKALNMTFNEDNVEVPVISIPDLNFNSEQFAHHIQIYNENISVEGNSTNQDFE